MTEFYRTYPEKRGKGSKYRGVYRSGANKWKAQIQIDGVQHYLGVFPTEDEAAKEFNNNAIRFGRPEITNVIQSYPHPIFSSNSTTTTSITPDDDGDMRNDTFLSHNSMTDMTPSDTSDSISKSKAIGASHAHVIYPMIKLGQICSELQGKYRVLQNKVSELFEENSSPLANIESLMEINEEISSLLKELQSQTQHLLPIVYKDKELKRALEHNDMMNYVREA